MVIWKYKLNEGGAATWRVPLGARVLKAGTDPNGELCVWLMVDEAARNEYEELLTFYAIGTGWQLTDQLLGVMEYFDSVTVGCYVWHIFVEKDRPVVSRDSL